MTDRTELRRLLDEPRGPRQYRRDHYNRCPCQDCKAMRADYMRWWRARQTPRYLAAKARIEAVRELHREATVKVLDVECADEECGHEDACPLVDYAVCAECHDIGDEAHPYAYEEGGVQRVAWPCATRRALDATPTGGES